MHQYVLHWEESNKKTVTPDQRHMRQTSIKGKHIPCPVCRNMIPYDLEELSSGIQPVEVTVSSRNCGLIFSLLIFHNFTA